MVLLCIDDDLEDQELFQEAIKTIDPDYTCISAYNGEDGLKMLSKVHPDMIFIDINMPIMDGSETLKALRQDSRLRRIPVCILSTSITIDEQATFKKMGVRCLKKPNRFKELCAQLKLILSVPSAI
jgi:CheY-like chemotaxis protein